MSRRRSLRLVVRLGAWLLVLFLAASFARFAADAARIASNSYSGYYTASRLLAEGAELSRLYDNVWFQEQIESHGPAIRDLYNAPPTTAYMLVPFVTRDYFSARSAWIWFNVGLLVVTTIWLLVEAGLRGLWLPAALAVILAFQPLYADIAQGQAYVLVLLLLVAAWHGYRRDRPGVTGAALGALLMIKPAGLLLWLLLAVQRRWRALAYGVATAVVLAVITLPRVGVAAWQTYQRALPNLLSGPTLSVTAFQTHHSLIHHVLVYDAGWNPAPLVHAPALAALLTALMLLGIVGLSAATALSGGRSDPLWAAFLLASIILSPVSQDYHYTLTLLPIVILMAWLQRNPRPAAIGLLAVGVVLIASFVDTGAPQRSAGAAALLAYPKLYGALLLWGLALWAARHDQAELAAPQEKLPHLLPENPA